MKQKIYLFLPLIFFISLSLSAQERLEANNIFIRVYDSKGLKFSKWKLLSIDENSIIVKRNKKSISIDVSEIGTIKTKRAFGHNVGMGALTGATIGIIIGFAQNPDDTWVDSRVENAAGIAILGLIVGPIVGGLTGIGKKSRSFEINQDSIQLLKFKELIHNQNWYYYCDLNYTQ